MLADRVRMGGGVAGDPTPGSKVLLGGDMNAGFFGEVSANDLISGDALALAIGLSDGTPINSDAGWLKFAWQNKIEFAAKRSFRCYISWNHINTAKAVYGDAGDKTVVIAGLTYKVRLFRGADPKFNPKTRIDQQTGGGNGYDGAVNHNSEWNRLMLPIHQEAITGSWDYPNNVENDIVSWTHSLGSGTQGRYNNADIIVGYGSGRYTLCQEMTQSTSNRLFRGYTGVSGSLYYTVSFTSVGTSWRPVLELVY